MEHAQQSFKELEVRLRLFVAARVSNRGDVDDVVQESFLKFHSACRDQVIANSLGYLCRVALNVIIDQGRRRTPLTNSVDIDGVAENCLAMEASQEQGRRLADLERAYHAALAELSPRCSEVFQLRRHQKMATPDVAARLSITTRMVQKHMVTAMAHLQDRLRPFLYGDHVDAASDDGGFSSPVSRQMTSSSQAHA
jgi:RNA polymerase sigma-70 factor (ECF subfamily)